jgi:hypothetical protein
MIPIDARRLGVDPVVLSAPPLMTTAGQSRQPSV